VGSFLYGTSNSDAEAEILKYEILKYFFI